ncbi:MAG: DNA repair protein RecO [Candidatus Firestonebacteria bacterium GWA2_43_8]|nr:MAG: DNA repair protein RecO [Candidatus Firestonebacteria bacterium GWA2_43_8]
MNPYHKTTGIITKVRSYGEANKHLTIYTKAYGKIHAVAKGAKKMKSRFGSTVELFTETKLFLYKQMHADLYLLTQSQIATHFKNISKDVKKYTYASAVSDFMNTFVPFGEKSHSLYELFSHTLHKLDTQDHEDKIFSMFMVKFLTQVGFRIALDSCTSCGSDLKQNQRMSVSPKHGGVVCEECASGVSTVEVYNNTLKLMDYLHRKTFETLPNITIGNQSHMEIEKVVEHFLEYNFELKLKSLKVMESIKSYGE